MKFFVLLLSLLSLGEVSAQAVISGQVIDADTRQPVVAASVFLTNTTIGTIADAQGNFSLSIPPGKYDVVFSSIGYYTRVISTTSADSFAIVKLTARPKMLEDVEIRFEKDGWEKWGKFFLENFIGTTDLSADCRLKNPGVLRFKHDRKKGELEVIAREPLIIENKALGYNVRYQMENFIYEFNTRQLYFDGFPYFEEMKGGSGRQKKWASNRLAAYEGSMMHFMRALYRNKLAAEGFEVHRLKKIKNMAKDSVRKRIASGSSFSISVGGDNILSQPDMIDVMSKQLLTGDSIAYATDSVTVVLEFPDYLDVMYTKRKAPVKYIELYPKATRDMISQVTLNEATAVNIQYNGTFTPTTGLLSLGYWAWREKMATLLPLNYQPPK